MKLKIKAQVKTAATGHPRYHNIERMLDIVREKEPAIYAQLLVNHAIPSYAQEDSKSEYWDSEAAIFLEEELEDVCSVYNC